MLRQILYLKIDDGDAFLAYIIMLLYGLNMKMYLGSVGQKSQQGYVIFLIITMYITVSDKNGHNLHPLFLFCTGFCCLWMAPSWQPKIISMRMSRARNIEWNQITNDKILASFSV